MCYTHGLLFTIVYAAFIALSVHPKPADTRTSLCEIIQALQELAWKVSEYIVCGYVNSFMDAKVE
jgi:hypothetical protein